MALESYRLLNWKRRRAPAWPYFLRSTLRASRREEVGVAEGFLEGGVVVEDGAGDRELDGPGLAHEAPAVDLGEDLHAAHEGH